MPLVLVMSVLLHAAPPELKAAEDQLRAFHYPEAQSLLARARAARGLERGTLLRILELSGVAAAQRRQTEAARQAFIELLTLDPQHKLEKDYAPRVMTPYLEAGQRVREAGALELTPLSPVIEAGQIVELGVQVSVDARNLARKVVFHLYVGENWSTVESAVSNTRATTRVASQELQWWAELVGESDAQLVLLGSQAGPLSVVAEPIRPERPKTASDQPSPPLGSTPPSTEAPSRPRVVRTASYFVLSAAGILLGVGIALGVRSTQQEAIIRTAARDMTGVVTGLSQVEAVAHAKDAGRDGLLANVFFVSAGVLAASGTAMFILGDRAPQPQLSLSIGPNGIVAFGTF